MKFVKDSKMMECTMTNKIDSFKGKYFFLSNFFESPVTWEGRTYQNNEAAFQSAKCVKESQRDKFTSMNPSASKRAGRNVLLRSDWEDIKENVMYEVCLAKFTQNPELGQRLLDTGDAELIEGNDWGDKTWGMVNGVGQNKLGKILMRIRKELKND